MPHLFSDIPDKLRLVLSQAANIFLVFIMIYIFQYIFNSQFSCTCTSAFHYIVVIYLALIPLILFFILKIMKQTKTKMCAACCYGLCPQLFQLLGISLFWGGFVLLDGDLYLCLATKHNDTLREIPCKKTEDLTLQEKSMITIYKNWSQLFGYSFIAVGFCGWSLISTIKTGMYCESFSCQRLKKCCCNVCKGKPYYKTRFEELLSEETDKHLDQKLRQIARKKVERIYTNHICDIENSELQYNITPEISKATEAWSNISCSDLYAENLPETMNHDYDDLFYFI